MNLGTVPVPNISESDCSIHLISNSKFIDFHYLISAPRKPDWDLKRDISKKLGMKIKKSFTWINSGANTGCWISWTIWNNMIFFVVEKLEKRTARAIGEIIRERLRGEDLANAVQAGASYAAADVDDD
jgi:hypothetical protein